MSCITGRPELKKPTVPLQYKKKVERELTCCVVFDAVEFVDAGQEGR